MGSHPMTWSATSQMEVGLWGGRVAILPTQLFPVLGVGLPSAGLCIQRGTFSQVTKYPMLRRVALKISI